MFRLLRKSSAAIIIALLGSSPTVARSGIGKNGRELTECDTTIGKCYIRNLDSGEEQEVVEPFKYTTGEGQRYSLRCDVEGNADHSKWTFNGGEISDDWEAPFWLKNNDDNGSGRVYDSDYLATIGRKEIKIDVFVWAQDDSCAGKSIVLFGTNELVSTTPVLTPMPTARPTPTTLTSRPTSMPTARSVVSTTKPATFYEGYNFDDWFRQYTAGVGKLNAIDFIFRSYKIADGYYVSVCNEMAYEKCKNLTGSGRIPYPFAESISSFEVIFGSIPPAEFPWIPNVRDSERYRFQIVYFPAVPSGWKLEVRRYGLPNDTRAIDITSSPYLSVGPPPNMTWQWFDTFAGKPYEARFIDSKGNAGQWNTFWRNGS